MICFFWKQKRIAIFLIGSSAKSHEKDKKRVYYKSIVLRILNRNIVAFIYTMTVLTERAEVWSCSARHPLRTFWTELCQVPTHAFAGLYSFCLVSGTCITMVMTNNVRARHPIYRVVCSVCISRYSHGSYRG